MSQPTAVDAASALALIADLYRQLTEAQQQLGQVTSDLADLRRGIREDAGVPTDAEAPA